EAAREAGGALGARAAWLLVDLLAGAGPSARPAHARALDAARRAAPSHAAAAFFAKLADRELDLASWRALLERLHADNTSAEMELSRLAARSGLRHVI